jgi:ketosteroid isomerase-like protein
MELMSNHPSAGGPAPGPIEGTGMADEITRTVIERFGQAFAQHDPRLLEDLLAEDCVLENSGPAPLGDRYEGRAACLAFWSGLAVNEQLAFEVEESWVAGDRAVRRWLLRWGPGASERVRGVNVMRVRDGLIVEAFGYVKG